MKKVLLLSLLLISNLMAGWMNVDSINVKQKWRNKKFNTDALLFVKSSDSLLDTCNIYSKSGLIGIATDAPVEPLTVAGDIWLYKNKGIILRGDDDAGYSSAIYMSTDEGLGADAYWGKLASIQCNAGKACFTFMAKDSTFTDLDDPTGYSYDTIMSINNHAGVNSVIIGNSTDHFYNPAVLHVIGDVKVDSGLTVDGKCSFDTLLLDSLYVSGGTHLNGKLGVGTNNPTTSAHIYGATGGGLTLESPNGKYAWIAAPSATDELTLYDYTSTNEILTVYNNSLGIMTDILGGPTSVLHVNGDTHIEDTLLIGDNVHIIGNVNINNTAGAESINFKNGSNVDYWTFYHSNTNNYLSMYSGNGIDGNFQIGSYTNSDEIYLNTATGRVGLNTSLPEGNLHIWNASAGTITAPTNGDQLIIEGNGNVGMSILTDDFGNGYYYIGSPSDNDFGYLRGDYTNGRVTIGNGKSSGNIRFNTAGNDRVIIDSAGLMGIGTTSPSSLLDVNGAAEINGVTTIQGTDVGLVINRTAGESFVNFQNGSGVNNWTMKSYNTNNILRTYSSGLDGYFVVSKLFNGNDFTINTSNGRVGVGTISPQGKIHIYDGASGTTPNGTANELVIEDDSYTGISLLTPDLYPSEIYFGNATDNIGAQLQWVGQYGFFQVGTDTSNGQIIFNSGDDVEAMRIDENGYVGIGFNNPTYPLHLHQTVTDCRMQITNSLTGTGVDNGLNITQNGLNAYLRNWENGFLRIGTNGADNISIASSGAVGVSTTTPLGKFDVSYSVNTDTPTICFGADGTFGSTSRTTSTTKRGAFGLVHYDLTEEPIAALYAYSESGVNNVVIGGGSSALNAATYLRFYTGSTATTTTGSEAMTINSSGNVGIGNTLPNYKLTVNGIARSSTVHTDSVYINDDRIRIANSNTPASASAAGTAGTICWDANYIYVCIATDTWKRTAISTW